jgi:hypothetical protein
MTTAAYIIALPAIVWGVLRFAGAVLWDGLTGAADTDPMDCDDGHCWPVDFPPPTTTEKQEQTT